MLQNEGFATFVERKIIKELVINGLEYYKLQSVLGNDTLFDTIAQFSKDDKLKTFTTLNPDTKGQNPEKAFNPVPYEKGYQFLLYINTWAMNPYHFKLFI